MPRRRAITDAQLEALLALPTAEPDLIRHYTLSPADLAVIARRDFVARRRWQTCLGVEVGSLMRCG